MNDILTIERMVNRMNNATMTREQLARHLNLSLPTIDGFLHRKENPIPSIRAGRRYIIPCALLEKWLVEEAERNMEAPHAQD